MPCLLLEMPLLCHIDAADADDYCHFIYYCRRFAYLRDTLPLREILYFSFAAPRRGFDAIFRVLPCQRRCFDFRLTPCVILIDAADVTPAVCRRAFIYAAADTP